MISFLQKKVDQANRIIDSAERLNLYCSCSWGKDSSVLLHLLVQHGWTGTVIWKAFPHEIPGQKEFREKVLKEWNIKDYREVGGGTLEEHLAFYHEHGLAGITEGKDHEKNVSRIKKSVLADYATANGFDGFFWGLRADEAIKRRWLLGKRGTLFQAQVDNQFRCSPLAWWTGKDIWAYIDATQIPYNPVYDNTLFEPREKIRNIGWLSTDGAERGRIVFLKYYYPELYQRLESEFPEVKNYV
jgi:3'-phosphoadenosine 5'-phosphosulfate sulfotransferase (PAPS reductase)/FAD synthetase